MSDPAQGIEQLPNLLASRGNDRSVCLPDACLFLTWEVA